MICPKLLQPENEDLPIVVTELGITIEVKLEQEEKAPAPIVITEFGMLIESISHPEKAYSPMETTVLGITAFLQPVISMLVDVSMIPLQLFLESYTAFPASTVICSMPLQYSNALPLIEVTELGMVNVPVKPAQLRKASSPIAVTELGIIRLPVRFSHQ